MRWCVCSDWLSLHHLALTINFDYSNRTEPLPSIWCHKYFYDYRVHILRIKRSEKCIEEHSTSRCASLFCTSNRFHLISFHANIMTRSKARKLKYLMYLQWHIYVHDCDDSSYIRRDYCSRRASSTHLRSKWWVDKSSLP